MLIIILSGGYMKPLLYYILYFTRWCGGWWMRVAFPNKMTICGSCVYNIVLYGFGSLRQWCQSARAPEATPFLRDRIMIIIIIIIIIYTFAHASRRIAFPVLGAHFSLFPNLEQTTTLIEDQISRGSSCRPTMFLPLVTLIIYTRGIKHYMRV